MTKLSVHKTINSFLEELKLPKSQVSSFYIVQYESYNSDINYNSYSYAHQFFEITLVTGYDAEVQVEHTKKNLTDFNLIFVSPIQKVTWKTNERFKNAKSYMLLFSPEILNQKNTLYHTLSTYSFFNRYTNSLFKLNAAQVEFLSNTFDKMVTEFQKMDADSLNLLSAYLSIVLIYLKRQLNLKQNLLYRKSRIHEIAINFEQLVLTEPIARKTIKYYAGKLNISTVYLAECIKKATQRTFKEIVNEYTILKAKSLLNNSDLSIIEVAEKLGFEEHSNFAKYFKKHTGQTPKSFKKPNF